MLPSFLSIGGHATTHAGTDNPSTVSVRKITEKAK